MHRLVLMFAVLLTAGTASAQVVSSQPVEDLRKNARVHVGPFYFTPTVQLRDVGIDGNVFNGPDDPKSDVMFNLSPRTELWVPIARRALFSATGAADLVWYAKYRSERSVDPQLTGRVDVYLHRLTLFARNAYVNTRQRFNAEVDLRARHLENTTSAGASYRVSPKLSVEVAGRLAITRFDADAVFLGSNLRDTLNHTTTGVNVTARHRVTPLTTVVLDLERSGDRFPYDSHRNTDTLRILPGVEFKPRALIRGSAHVGFRRFTPADASALSGYSGLVAEYSGAIRIAWSVKSKRFSQAAEKRARSRSCGMAAPRSESLISFVTATLMAPRIGWFLMLLRIGVDIDGVLMRPNARQVEPSDRVAEAARLSPPA